MKTIEPMSKPEQDSERRCPTCGNTKGEPVDHNHYCSDSFHITSQYDYKEVEPSSVGEKPQAAAICAKRLWIDCYPVDLDNGDFIKSCWAKRYATKIAKEIITEYTNDENHDRVLFWKNVITEIENI